MTNKEKAALKAQQEVSNTENVTPVVNSENASPEVIQEVVTPVVEETKKPEETKKEEKQVIIILEGKWGRKDKNVLIDVTANLKLKKKITNKNIGVPDPLFKVVKELFVTCEFKGIKKEFHFMENEFLDIEESMFQEEPKAEEVIK